MPYQLIIRKLSDSTLAALFAHAQRVDFERLPQTAEVPGGRLCIEAGERRGQAQVRYQGSEAASLNGVALGAGQAVALRHGDAITVGETQVRFYQQYGRPGVSWRANALGHLARVGVLLSIAVEIAAFVVLPLLLHKSDRFRREQQLQEIAYQTDEVRHKLNKLDTKDAVTNTYLNALRDELADRVRFLRKHSGELSASQRQAMLENLKQLSKLLDQVQATPNVLLPLPELKLDAPIRNIIETK